MSTVKALVKNLESNSDELNFSNFRLKKIQQDDDDAREQAKTLFPSGDPDFDDWIFERTYNDEKANWGNDIEETLFLLRLFKVGDIVFLQPREIDGKNRRQSPYRITSDIDPFHIYTLEDNECSQFDQFAMGMKSQKNWGATWFQTARRFFLYGSSKEFNPLHSEVDRIVDYIVAMESILVPESDFIKRRLKERAVSLLNGSIIDQHGAKSLIGKFYDLRSRIVHGDNVLSLNNNILDKSIEFKFENILREIIKKAVKLLPEEGDRKAFLEGLFDVSDQIRAEKISNDFRTIKDANEKRKCFDLISKFMS